jgi:hypothetical protein
MASTGLMRAMAKEGRTSSKIQTLKVATFKINNSLPEISRGTADT